MRTLTAALSASPGALNFEQRLAASTSARDFVHWIKALAVGGPGGAVQAFGRLGGSPAGQSALEQRSAVSPGSLTDGSFGSPLVAVQGFAQSFMSLVRPQTILGKLPGIRSAPFNTAISAQSGGASASWVGEGSPAPLSRLALQSLTLAPTKISAVILISDELARSSAPSAADVIAADLAAALVAFSDQSFLDPTQAAVSGVSPASVTFNAPTIAATGTTLSALQKDLRLLVQACLDTGGDLGKPCFVCDQVTALSLSLLDTGGLIRDGTLGGVPLLISNSAHKAGDSPDARTITLIDGAGIVVADNGVEVDRSREASLQMESTPVSPATAATVTLNLFQRGLVAFRASRQINWAARSGAVAVITGASYGA